MNKIKSFFKRLSHSPVVKALLIWVVIVIFLAFLVDKLLMPIFSGAFTSTGAVPEVIGMDQAAAEKALEEAGFKFEWVEEGRYNAQIPAGKVLVQLPAAGREAKIGRTVKLTKSLGLREVEIPELRGSSQKQAEITLTRAGLVKGATLKGAHQSIPRGVVIRTEPMGGTMARVGDTVNIIISAGEKSGKVLLPSFEGMRIDEAFPQIEKLGLKVGNIKRVKPENGEAAETILYTKPKDGDYLPPDTKVHFYVAE